MKHDLGTYRQVLFISKAVSIYKYTTKPNQSIYFVILMIDVENQMTEWTRAININLHDDQNEQSGFT
jgi:hypothetical protein